MALFMPSFVTPDLRNGLGQGVADVSQGLTVSWQVNGPSAMTAFSVTVFALTSASTQLYTTGKRTDGCPFFGTNPRGKAQRFSYTIPAAALSDAGVVNGAEYKLVITQWWSDTQSVTQSSASAFVTRSAPEVSISEIGTDGTVGTRFYTFSGIYAQAQGDVLNWFRWRLADSDGNLLYDTGAITGTMDLSFTYDGLFSSGAAGTEYAVRLNVETENGVEADTLWVPFTVFYPTPEVSGFISALCRRDTNAVYVSWEGLSDIPGTPEGDWALSGGDLVLEDGTVTWDTVSGDPMQFGAPWSLVMQFSVFAGRDAQVLTLGQDGGDLSLVYSGEENRLTLSKGPATLWDKVLIDASPVQVTLVLTQDTLYLRQEGAAGALYPSAVRYPSETLYPSAGVPEVVISSDALRYVQEPVTSVTASGYARFSYLELLAGEAPEQIVKQAITDGTYQPGKSAPDYFLADFDGSLNAGRVAINGQEIVGFDIYRRASGENVLSHVAEIGFEARKIFDYGVRSRQGPYFYYLFPQGTDRYIAEPFVSSSVSPCFADWSVMECAPANEDGTLFSVLAEYRFGKNLNSGSMSNNNRPDLEDNFTPYPTVMRSPQNYRSGSLNALIGGIDYADGNRYSDSLALRDRLFGLSVTENALFLKSRKGDLLRIRVGEPVSMVTADATVEQAQSVSLPWVESGSADGVSLYAQGSAAVNGDAPGAVSCRMGQGAVFYPDVSASGVLTWQSSNGSPVPPPLDLTQYIPLLLPNADVMQF